MAPYFFRQRCQLIHRPDVSVHAEDAVGNHQLFARLAGHFFQQGFTMFDVLVPENFNRRPRQPRPVNDAGVVQFVGQDKVLLAQNRADRAGVGRKAALKNHAGLHILEAGNLFFQLHVNAHRSRNRSHRA